MMLLYLDYTLEPKYSSYSVSSSTSSSTDPPPNVLATRQAAKSELDLINRVYVGAAAVRYAKQHSLAAAYATPRPSLQLHIVNAFMYIWQWWPLGYRWNGELLPSRGAAFTRFSLTSFSPRQTGL